MRGSGVLNVIIGGILLFVSCVSALTASAEGKERLFVGFHSPSGVDKFIYHVDFSLMEAYLHNDPSNGRPIINLEYLRPNFEILKGMTHKLHIDIRHIICESKETESIVKTYIAEDEKTYLKAFSPLSPNKLLNIVSDSEIESRLKGLTDFVWQYRENIGVLFIADEPYLNGINRQEVERAIRKIRAIFARNGIQHIEIGIIFASGMFNANFAAHIQKAMAKYVAQTDDAYFKERLSALHEVRLTTYDACSNIFTGGGLPKGLDVVAFDFYLSTLLLDQVHEATLKYYADHDNNKACAYFKNTAVTDIRKKLSFFRDLPNKIDQSQIETDRKILDMAFDCRMEATVNLLTKEIGNAKYDKNPKIMLIGEASANGLMNFQTDGTPKSEQLSDIIEQRMMDEVRRTFDYYLSNIKTFNGGLMFFLYPDSYDKSIKLLVRGAKGAKKVTKYIYDTRNLVTSKVKGDNHPPVLSSLGNIMAANNYRLTEKDAALFMSSWFVSLSPVIAFDRDDDAVQLSTESSNASIIDAGITPDNRLKLKYNSGMNGAVTITVTATNNKGLRAAKRFTITILPD